MVNKPSHTVNFFTPVQAIIPKVEELMRAQAEGHHPDLGAALEHLLSSGGKRIRPAIALLTGGMFGGNQEKLITLAAAIELLHTATLVHDDLIDGALLRRGIATLNSQWSPAATVLTGDFVFARAAQLAAETRSPEVIRLFARTLAVIVDGEITQLFSSKGVISRENYYQRIYAKTASMFELATSASSILAEVDDYVKENMREFGYGIGMAFQIVDDILDFTGEQETVGKPVANDLRQGLVTLPALYFVEAHPEHDGIREVISGKHYSEATLERVVNDIRSSGAIEKAMEEARAYVERSLEILEDMPDTPEKHALADLAHYVSDRHF